MTAVLPMPSILRWRQTLPVLLLLLVAVLVLYRDTALAMVAIWERSETFAHGFVVPPIVLWLIWRQREALAVQVPRPTAWALLPIAGAALLWLLGDMVAINAVTQLAFTALLVLTVFALLGWQATRVIVFPLAFLFFAVPVGEFLMPQLMLWTADFTVAALRLSGIPVYREGQQFIIPTGSWSVVEACSGIRYLIASVMVGVLFAYLNYRTLRRRLMFIGVAIVVPLVANWVRAYLIVLIGHLSDNRIATGVDHLVYGWLFFGVVIFLMFMIGARWAEPPVSDAPPGSRAVAAPQRDRAAWAVAAAVALLLAAPHLAMRAMSGADAGVAPILVAAPVLAPGWSLAEKPVVDWQPAFQGPSAELNRTYIRADGQRVGLYIGYYRHQGSQRELVSSANMLVKSNDRHWVPVASGSRSVPVAGRSIALRTTELGPPASSLGGEHLEVWQIYWANGTFTSSDMAAKAYGVLRQLLGRGDDGAVIVVYTPVDGGAGQARLADFVHENLEALEAQLKRTREGG
jgi:exosortase A